MIVIVFRLTMLWYVRRLLVPFGCLVSAIVCHARFEEIVYFVYDCLKGRDISSNGVRDRVRRVFASATVPILSG